MASIAFSPRALAQASSRHPWRTVTGWALVGVLAVVAIGALLPGALISGGNPTNNPQSQRARELIQRDFPTSARAAATDVIVVSSSRYSVDAPEFRAVVHQLSAEAQRAKGITSVHTYLEPGAAGLVSRDRHATMIQLAIPNPHMQSNGISTVIGDVQRANAQPAF